MKRSMVSVGKILLVMWAASFFAPMDALSQQAAEIGASPKLIISGGFDDDKVESMKAEQARQTGAMREEQARYRAGRDMAPSASAGKSSKKAPDLEMSLEEQPLTEGIDLTTEALDEMFFRDIARQENLTYQELYETAGSLQDDVESIGEIIDGEPSNQITFSLGDTLYINRGTLNGIEYGMQLGVLKKGRRFVYHPVTGSFLGKLVTLEGVIRVVEANEKIAKVRVTRSYSGLERGDLLVPYEKPLLPSMDPDKPVIGKEINGYIITARDPKEGMANGDVIFVDVGAEKGVSIGDVFNVIDNRSVVRNDGRIVEGIPKIIGKLKIISTKEATATALVTKCQTAIYAGDKVEFSPN